MRSSESVFDIASSLVCYCLSGYRKRLASARLIRLCRCGTNAAGFLDGLEYSRSARMGSRADEGNKDIANQSHCVPSSACPDIRATNRPLWGRKSIPQSSAVHHNGNDRHSAVSVRHTHGQKLEPDGRADRKEGWRLSRRLRWRRWQESGATCA